MAVSRNRSAALLSSVSSEIGELPAEPSSLVEHYTALDVMGNNVRRLQTLEQRGGFLEKTFGFHRGDEVLAALKEGYFAKVKRFIVAPALKYIEYEIRGTARSYGELSGDDYDKLYAALKAYLSMSEAASERRADIDTSFLRPVLQEAITGSLMSTLKRSRLPRQVETILGTSLGSYLYYLKSGEYPLIQENQKIVSSARRRLRRLPDAGTLYRTVVNRLSSEAPDMNLDDILEREGEGILQSGATISGLYTQEGWDQLVMDAIDDACKDPFKIDWVIGLTKDQVPESKIDVTALRSDMLGAYIDDFRRQWLAFLSSITLEPFGDLSRSKRILQMLVSDQSELASLLEAVSTYTVIKQESALEGAAEKALSATSKLKKAKKLKKVGTMARKGSAAAKGSFSFNRKTPFENLNDTFDQLRTFSRSTAGALSGFGGYRDQIMTLVEQLGTIETRGDDQSVVVFNGSDSDPLLSAWKYTQNVLNGQSPELADALRGVLLAPLEYTGRAASEVLSESLNLRWQNEIVRAFTSRFSGRYPFTRRGEDASFDDVMDFFRPATGTFWGFYERVLASFVIKTAAGWRVRSPASLDLTFNPKLASSLTAAERVRDVFFKPNGEPRSMAVTFSPSGSNKPTARIDVAGQMIDLAPGGRSMSLKWPLESQEGGASLKVQVEKDFSQDISFQGKWGLMKLLQAATVNSVNSSTVMATWKINVQNMYMIYQKYRVQPAGPDHPFGESPFAAFDCPTDLMVKSDETATAAEQ
jgi:type VI secretion system protein ImpL